jgi:hypothetical protein
MVEILSNGLDFFRLIIKAPFDKKILLFHALQSRQVFSGPAEPRLTSGGAQIIE